MGFVVILLQEGFLMSFGSLTVFYKIFQVFRQSLPCEPFFDSLSGFVNPFVEGCFSVVTLIEDNSYFVF